MSQGAIAGALLFGGAAVSVYGKYQSYKAGQKAERLRLRQVENEQRRAQREQIRRAQVARAKATAAAYNQGAGDSSALAGGQSQIAATAARNITGIRQDFDISKSIFKTNEQKAQGEFITDVGQGISSLGGAVASYQSSPSGGGSS